jgi:hypothetical protein
MHSLTLAANVGMVVRLQVRLVVGMLMGFQGMFGPIVAMALPGWFGRVDMLVNVRMRVFVHVLVRMLPVAVAVPVPVAVPVGVTVRVAVSMVGRHRRSPFRWCATTSHYATRSCEGENHGR